MSRMIVSVALVALVAVACSDSAPTTPTPGTAQPRPSAPPPPTVPTPPPPSPATTEYLYVAAADGSGATKLTAGSWASWSPDGRRLVFHRGPTWAAPLFPGSIYLIDADGTRETKLIAGKWPSWSPDGQQIAFVDDEGIQVMGADGSNKQLLLRHYFRDDTYPPWDMGPAKPVWSPDGKRIAFEHLGDGDMQPAQVFVMSVDGSKVQRMSVGPISYAESDPAWSPDGSKLAYWSYGFGLAISDVGGGPPRTVFSAFPNVSYGAKPAWSRDGTSLAFNMWGAGPGSTRSVFVVDLVTSAFQRLVRDGFDLAFSADQKRLVYTSARNDST